LKILFLHEVNYLTKPIFEMHEFPEYLAALGHEVGFVQFPEGLSKSELANTPFKQEIAGRVLTDARLTLYTPKTLSGGLSGRLLTVLTFRKQFRNILQDFKPDVIISFAVPTSGWQALSVAKKSGVPFVFRSLDVSHKIRRSIFSPLVAMAERFIYRNADWVSANNPAMLKYCIGMGALQDRSSVELPPLDLSHFDTGLLESDALRERYKIPMDARVTLYMGSFFYFSGLPELIRAFRDTRKDDEYLVLVGGGEQEKQLRKQVAALNMEDFVKFTGFVSFEELPGHLRMANVAVNPMHVSTVSNAAFPNKVIQYMAAGLPVVSTRLDGLVQTFGHDSQLQYVEKSSEVYPAVQALFRSKSLAVIGRANHAAVQERFSSATAVRAMEARLEFLIGAKS
jgi:glycosyltransferase involved in cell wall biosynthesis